MPAPLAAADPPAPRASGGDARDSLRVRADAAGGAARAAALACLAANGAVLLEAALPEAAVAAAAAALAPFLEDVAARWDADADALPLSWRRWGITRCPRVNAGKKNVHFDPHGSELHDALAALAASGGFEALLSAHCGGRCTLSESGLSLTRPGGSGMEWHADGTRGEATVLLALQDVPPEAGPLGIVPASHLRYSTSKAANTAADSADVAGDACACACEGDADQAAAVMAQCAPPLWYAYRRGMPALLDARTLHAAADNCSDALRAVVWLIYTQDDAADGGDGDEHGSAGEDAADDAGEALAALNVQ